MGLVRGLPVGLSLEVTFKQVPLETLIDSPLYAGRYASKLDLDPGAKVPASEDGSDPESFTSWDKTAYVRDLLPHEFTHSWSEHRT